MCVVAGMSTANNNIKHRDIHKCSWCGEGEDRVERSIINLFLLGKNYCSYTEYKIRKWYSCWFVRL